MLSFLIIFAIFYYIIKRVFKPSNLEKLFNQLVQGMVDCWKKHHNFDGKSFFQELKQILPSDDEPVPSFDWKAAVDVWSANLACEKTDAMIHFINMIETIPQKDSTTLKKIMQVALNVGQLIGTGGNCPYFRLSDFAIIKKDLSDEDYVIIHANLTKLLERHL